MIGLIRFVVGLLPGSALKSWLLTRTGYSVSSTSRVGPCLIWKVDSLIVGDEARIGPFNVFRNLTGLSLGDNAVIGQWNWFSSAPSLVGLVPGGGTLTIGRHSAVTSRHYIDASGPVSIGTYTTVAGVRSTFVTHGIRWVEGQQSTKGISVGDYCLIGSNCAVTPGSTIADRTVVGMGEVIGGGHSETATLLLSPRAEVAKRNLEGRYFSREVGYVD